MAQNDLLRAALPLKNYSLNHSLTLCYCIVLSRDVQDSSRPAAVHSRSATVLQDSACSWHLPGSEWTCRWCWSEAWPKWHGRSEMSPGNDFSPPANDRSTPPAPSCNQPTNSFYWNLIRSQIHKTSYNNFRTKILRPFLDILWQIKWLDSNPTNKKNFFMSIYKTSNSIILITY